MRTGRMAVSQSRYSEGFGETVTLDEAVEGQGRFAKGGETWKQSCRVNWGQTLGCLGHQRSDHPQATHLVSGSAGPRMWVSSSFFPWSDSLVIFKSCK